MDAPHQGQSGKEQQQQPSGRTEEDAAEEQPAGTTPAAVTITTTAAAEEEKEEAEEEAEAKRRRAVEEGVGPSPSALGAAPAPTPTPAPAPTPTPPLAPPPPLALPEQALSLILLGRMMPMALMRILFYLDRPDLLLVVAVASKHMNRMAKHDVLWRLSLTTTDKPDTQDMSGVALNAQRVRWRTPCWLGPVKMLEEGAKYGHFPPTDEQVVTLDNPNAQLWFRFHVDVVRESVWREGLDALMDATRAGNVGKLRLLLWGMVRPFTSGRHYYDLHDRFQMTALMYAALEGHAECLQMLIEAGSVVTVTNYHKRTALTYAAQSGSAECARILIEAGSDVTTKDDFQMTALMSAAANGCAECTRMLLEAGGDSDVLAEDSSGRTAMTFAKREGHTAVIALLKGAIDAYELEHVG